MKISSRTHLDSYFRNKVALFLVLVVVATASLIFINAYSSRIRSSMRAYINGESEYSKGQKDAFQYLITYIETQDNTYWLAFKRSIAVPKGDNIARNAMLNEEAYEVVYAGFYNGKNHPKDIPGMIWLFKNFRFLPPFKEAIGLWAESEVILKDFNQYAYTLHKEIEKGQFNPTKKQIVYRKLAQNNERLTKMETRFSSVLSATVRDIETILFYANIVITLLVVCSLAGYLIFTIVKLYRYQQELIETNDVLTEVNSDLDIFTYSVSHDLRTPIASLQSLIQLAQSETDMNEVKDILSMMQKITVKQDNFIKDIINLLQSKHKDLLIEEIDVEQLIDEILEQNVFTEAIKVNAEVSSRAKNIQTDRIYLRIILSNLVSNAFKYVDLEKEQHWVQIRADVQNNMAILEIQDNGRGISKEYHAKIFDMFYKIGSDKRSTGLGLYIVKGAVNKLKGKINLKSEQCIGTQFTITFPLN